MSDQTTASSTSLQAQHAKEIKTGERFEFGKWWATFLKVLNEERVVLAENSVKQMLGVETLQGKTFLDVGCGSGLFSLAARRLGAKVFGFDYDPECVACSEEVRRRFRPNDSDEEWHIEQGSVLDPDYMKSRGKFDVVYAWGMLHQTGQMWKGMDLVRHCVKPGGTMVIAVYNDQGWITRYWRFWKSTWNRHRWLRPLIIAIHAPYLLGGRYLGRAIKRRPLQRGMSVWHDMIGWLGGYPHEVAKPEELVHFFTPMGFHLKRLTTVGNRQGNNEYVFELSAPKETS